MSSLARLSLSLIIIFASILAGWLCQQAIRSRRLRVRQDWLDRWRSRAQMAAIFLMLPLAAMLSLWALPRPDPELLILPLLGLLAYTAGGVFALGFARLLKMPPRQAGAYYCCGAYNNIGAIGGMVCLLFLGEASIALTALFRLLEELYYFGISFPVAARHAQDPNGARRKGARSL